jgi:hypothetical protein
VALFAIVNVPILDRLRSFAAWTSHSENLSLLPGHYPQAFAGVPRSATR